MGWVQAEKGAGRGKAAEADSFDQESSLKDDETLSDDISDYDEELDRRCRPDTVDRRCTDVWWVFPFLVGLAALSWVSQYALENGDLMHFRAFMDLQGKFCYHGGREKYLYFCQNHPGQLNISNPICVSSCPNDTVIEHSFACEAYGIFKNTSDYSTEPYFGMVCKPMEERLRLQVQHYLIQTRHSMVKRLILRSPQTIVACVFFAVITSYMYLGFLGRCAQVVVYTGLCLAIAVPIVFGLYLMGWMTWVGAVPRPYQMVGRFDANPFLGAGLLFIGVSCGCCCMRMSVHVEKALQCLEDAIDCCMDTPVLQWQPVIHLVTWVIVCFVPCASIIYLLSCQDVTLAYKAEGPLVHLMLLTSEQCCYLAVLVFMLFWIHQINHMTSTFVIAYLAQLWYYNGGEDGEGVVPHGALCQAYWACYRYHFGTMLKGALAVGLTWPVRNIMGAVVGFTEMKANAVGHLVHAACCLCIACFERWFEMFQKGVMLEVVLNARPFCPSARVHIRIVDEEAYAKRILHGASRAFQGAGLMIISLVGAFGMCLMRTREGGFDVESDRQMILAQLTFIILGFLIALAVAFPFMVLFHTIADTLLYIRTVEMLRSMAEQKWDWSPSVLQCVCCKRVRPPDALAFFDGYEESRYDDHNDKPRQHSDKRGRSSSRSGRRDRDRRPSR